MSLNFFKVGSYAEVTVFQHLKTRCASKSTDVLAILVRMVKTFPYITSTTFWRLCPSQLLSLGNSSIYWKQENIYGPHGIWNIIFIYLIIFSKSFITSSSPYEINFSSDMIPFQLRHPIRRTLFSAARWSRKAEKMDPNYVLYYGFSNIYHGRTKYPYEISGK